MKILLVDPLVVEQKLLERFDSWAHVASLERTTAGLIDVLDWELITVARGPLDRVEKPAGCSVSLHTGSSYPTAQSKMGRAIGFTDWLWGGGGGSPPPPTATPKPTAAPTATPKPTATPFPTPPPPPPPGDVPVVTTPRVNLSTTSQVSTSGVPTVVGWNLAGDDPLKRYEFQAKVDGGSFAGKSLASSTAKFYRTTLGSGRAYTYRVRPVDSKNRVGAWRSVGPVKGISVPDNASSIAWSGAWSTASHGDYLGDKVHWTKTAGAKATFTFKGSSIAWVGPVGPTRGKAYVHIDGKYIKTVDLKASSFVARRILFAATLPQGTHKIKIKVLAPPVVRGSISTPSSPRADRGTTRRPAPYGR